MIPPLVPQIGEVVQFRISPSTVRPLLVVSIQSTNPPILSGLLFVDANRDGGAEWIQRNCFNRPIHTAPYHWVGEKSTGDGLGEWRVLGLPEGVSEPTNLGRIMEAVGS
jgi:hypothetical protein